MNALKWLAALASVATAFLLDFRQEHVQLALDPIITSALISGGAGLLSRLLRSRPDVPEAPDLVTPVEGQSRIAEERFTRGAQTAREMLEANDAAAGRRGAGSVARLEATIGGQSLAANDFRQKIMDSIERARDRQKQLEFRRRLAQFGIKNQRFDDTTALLADATKLTTGLIMGGKQNPGGRGDGTFDAQIGPGTTNRLTQAGSLNFSDITAYPATFGAPPAPTPVAAPPANTSPVGLMVQDESILRNLLGEL